jgi:hypothetical protein
MFRYLYITLLSILLAIFGCTGHNDRPDKAMNLASDITESIGKQGYIEFEKLSHDFGTLIEGEQVVCYFGYANTGEGSVLIQDVKSSCGCTVPDYSSLPLQPGDSSILKVLFNTTGRQGEQLKIITVRSNAENSEVSLKIKASIGIN